MFEVRAPFLLADGLDDRVDTCLESVTMDTIPVEILEELSRPTFELFARVEPKPWDRRAILVELAGEIGSLAHLVQHWDGFKAGRPHVGKMADECSDVLLIILRLALEDGIQLPARLELCSPTGQRAADLVISLSECFSKLTSLTTGTEDVLCRMLQTVGAAARLFGFDLVEAHRREMEICQQFFAASGEDWPRPQFLRHPVAAFRLWRLLRQRRKMASE